MFSVDGSFAANISISAKDVKVKDGAVEVARLETISLLLCTAFPRLWQERGYLIIYVTGRPEFQKDAVVAWLAKHQFPLGVVSCCETISTVNEMRANKVLYLGRLIRQVGEIKGVCVIVYNLTINLWNFLPMNIMS